MKFFLFLPIPLTEILPANSSMIATGVVSPFLTPLRLTFYVATFVAIPYLLFELWNFIAPGLYKEEKIGFFRGFVFQHSFVPCRYLFCFFCNFSSDFYFFCSSLSLGSFGNDRHK
jgi:sec-independent protein translocase protein TatC